MAVLVTFATKHGGTAGIAERIADRLRAGGLDVAVQPVKQVRDVDAYDAVVLGSALYMFHWMGAARSFAARNHDALSRKPLWLFSSGPIEAVDKEGRNQLEVSGSTRETTRSSLGSGLEPTSRADSWNASCT